MSNFFSYNIAGFPVLFETGLENAPLDKIEGFKLFRSEEAAPVLRYSTCGTLSRMEEDAAYANENKPLYSFDFDDEDIKCFFYRDGEKLIFKMIPHKGEIHLFTAQFTPSGSLNVLSNWEENKHASMLRFSMWMAFAAAVAHLSAIPIHSSVNVYDGKAVLFLGESGTGKSTHTRLWRENIPDVFLLNDDSPIIKVATDSSGKKSIIACGSPWSGKTPCYRKEEYPVAGIVRLSQGPANVINRLSKLSAFGAIFPSCPPSFAHDNLLEDDICNTISSILSNVPVFHLSCLPDADAAHLSFNTIFRV